MHYVYILQSRKDGSYYVGSTADLKRRLAEHNSGKARYSSSKRPYVLAWYGAFNDVKLAREFEKYLKSSSGFAFRNKRLIT